MIIKKSFAKINLYLEIAGRDQKGYHLLNSLIGFLDIYDIIKIEAAEELSLEIKGPYSQILQDDKKENIIISAAKTLAKNYNFSPNIKISLTKNIPIGAGIGGGSSNCATILLMLNEFYKLEITLDRLKEISLQLGSDVPICLHQKMSLVRGVGEKITDTEFKEEPLFILLANPNKHLSTKKVFDLFQEKYQFDDKQNNKYIISGSLIDHIKNHQNHLTQAAIEEAPEIKEILNYIAIQDNCLITRMSGSGSTCFGIFDKKEDLKLAKKNLQHKFPEFYVTESNLLYKI